MKTSYLVLVAQVFCLLGLLGSQPVAAQSARIFFSGEDEERTCVGGDQICAEGEAPFAVHLNALYGFDDFKIDLVNSTKPYANLLRERDPGVFVHLLKGNMLSDPCKGIDVHKPTVSCEPVQGAACTDYIARSDLRIQCNADAEAFVTTKNAEILGNNDPIAARFQWSFDDPTSDFNDLEGFNASKVYDVPGDYTIKLKLTNSEGRSSERLLKIRVLASTRVNFYVASNGSDANDGLSMNSPMSIHKLIDLLSTRRFPKASNFQILFRKGDAFNVSQTIAGGVKQTGIFLESMSNVVIGAYEDPQFPSTSKPVLYSNVGSSSIIATTRGSIENRLVVQDVAFDDNPSGILCLNHCGRTATGDAVTLRGTNFVIRRVDVRNVNHLANLNQDPFGVLIQQNKSLLPTGLRMYLVWLGGQDISILGNEAVNSVEEHIIRGAGYNRVLIHKNILSNMDRRALTTDFDVAKAALNIQFGQFVYMSQNLTNPAYHATQAGELPGGPSGMGPLSNKDGTRGEETRYVVFERNFLNSSSLYVTNGASHVMIRNNISKGSSRPSLLVEGYVEQISGTVYRRTTSDIRVVNNTLVNESQSAVIINLGMGSKDVLIKDNIVSAPNMIAALDGAAPFTVSGSSLSNEYSIQENLHGIASSAGWCGQVDKMFRMAGDCNFLSLNEWNALASVQNEQQFASTLNAQFKPNEIQTEFASATPGIFNDYYGQDRSSLSTLTVGAVERKSSATPLPNPNPNPNPSPIDNNLDLWLSTYVDSSTRTLNVKTSITSQRPNDIKKVEYFNSQTGLKLSESVVGPQFISWNTMPAGTYQILAVAYNSANGKKNSNFVSTTVISSGAQPPLPEPNPNPNPLPDPTPAINPRLDLWLNTYVSQDQATHNLKLSITSQRPAEIARVEYYNSQTNQKLAESLQGDTFEKWVTASAGNYSIKAVAYDAEGAQKTSNIAVVVVSGGSAAPTNPNLDLWLSIYVPPGETNLKFSITSQRPAEIKRVAYFNNATGVKLGESIASDNFIVYATLPIGSYTLKAVAYDVNGASKNSNLVNVNITSP